MKYAFSLNADNIYTYLADSAHTNSIRHSPLVSCVAS